MVGVGVAGRGRLKTRGKLNESGNGVVLGMGSALRTELTGAGGRKSDPGAKRLVKLVAAGWMQRVTLG